MNNYKAIPCSSEGSSRNFTAHLFQEKQEKQSFHAEKPQELLKQLTQMLAFSDIDMIH